MQCYRCGCEMNERACKIECSNCGYALTCSDV